MAELLQRGIVRLFRDDGSPRGKTLGTAFLVHREGLLLTCAHVLEKEEGVPDGTRAVSLEFCANGATATARVLPQYWRASNHDDVAVLQLEGLVVLEDFATAESGASVDKEGGNRPVVLPLGYSVHL